MSDDRMSAESTKVASFFKKGKVRPASVRRRSPGGGGGVPPGEGGASEVVMPVARKGPARVLSQGTKRRREEDDEDGEEAGQGGGLDVNWAGGAASNVHAARAMQEGDEAAALLARKRAKAERDAEDEAEAEAEGAADDGLYRGQAAYKTHIAKNKEVPRSLRVGPQRVSGSTIRTVTVVDYQPDVCKDYKETGFCGFGDTCKFLHDRGTYLAGWQLDQVAEKASRAGGQEENGDSDDEEDDVPFACLICRKAFTDPVVTRCGHYYCSECAIRRYAKTPRCLACGAPTGGIFNRAEKVLARQTKENKEVVV